LGIFSSNTIKTLALSAEKGAEYAAGDGGGSI
jgi:hypothetical protein